jgi:hypothetical protein
VRVTKYKAWIVVVVVVCVKERGEREAWLLIF